MCDNVTVQAETLAKLRAYQNYALRKACSDGDLPTLVELMSQGLTLADLRDVNNDALKYACMHGHLPVVKGAAMLIQ